MKNYYYIFAALRYKNGTYILNGEWLQSAAGSFDAAGTKFTYVRGFNNVGDTVSATGPLLQPLELLVRTTGTRFKLTLKLHIPYKYRYLCSIRSEMND